MKNINIRLACPNDLDFIYNSLIELFTEGQVIERFSQNRTSLSQILFSSQPGAEVLISEIENIPTGFALFSMTNRNFPLFDGPGLYLHDLYVKRQYRRMGIGTKLVNQLKKIAKDRSCTRIDWVLLKNNTLGKDFYASIDAAKPVGYIEYMRINCTDSVS
ncbi:N-acetyltransferase ats1 [Legionella lansingensis]|uniref:N-acetyltransferase ats1 n=1 Tax=Legionella lansingensis TaxID=45067 RepID=A0A0W0VEH8_9GAMM|nr:GNAT family N-acetyltransferase [Legionella lansingensis]KTD18535.1 N-acetyltransferase ats1 [Legionella lansingensis]SNV50945.1 N-acetyltransferase ats1 [Legionella lansingensis]